MPVKILLALLMALQLVLIPQSAHAMTSNTFENRVRNQLNDHRAPDLRQGRCLDRYAEGWARYLKRSGEFDHRIPSQIRKGCNLSASGEILARGYKSPRATVRAWLRSPKHKAIIQDSRYKRVGVGARRVYGGWIVVVNFGRH